MKKSKIWSLAALCASIVLSAGTAAACSHQHEYGEWTLTTAPTETVSGKATRECSKGDNKEEVDVAPLTDTSVWTLESEEAATHLQDGKKKYTSQYGEVEVTVNKTPHTYGDWTITKQPTLTDGGTATRNCSANDNGKEEKSIAKLTDTSVWTAKVNKAPTHTEKGETVYTSDYGTVKIATDKLTEHSYGEWTIVKKPTMLEEGKAERECSANDDTDEKVLPVLGDDTFWSVEVKKTASHTEKGETQYKSDYGTVVVETEKLTAHTYGAWKIDREPDLESTGLASRVCTANDGGKDEKTLPVLTDTTVWTEDTSKRVEPTATKNGTAVYTSEYGTVTVVLARLSAPFYDKTYYNFNYGTTDSNKALNTQTSWSQAHVTLDGEGKGTGDAHPFLGAVSVKYAETGSDKVTVKIGETTYDGYVEEHTGIIVMFGGNDIFVLTPYTRPGDVDKYETAESTYSVSDAKASTWTYEGGASPVYAVTYNYAKDSSLNFYIDADKVVHFGVTFTDIEGKAVAAENCYNADYVYVKSGDKVIASFGYDVYDEDDAGMYALDGLEGRYTLADNDLLSVTGFGKVMIGPAAAQPAKMGTYEVVDGKLHAHMWNVTNDDEEFFIYTLNTDDNTYTAVKPMVTISFVGGEYSDDDEKEYNANVVAALPTPASSDELYVFAGWYTDAACTTKVADDYKPAADATLYAKWVKKVIIKYVAQDGAEAVIIEAGVGDVLTDKLPTLGIEVANSRFFVGWKYTENGSDEKKDLPAGIALTESNSGITVYAQWQTLPSYYGSYAGYYSQSSLYTTYTAEINITEIGKITGKLQTSSNAYKTIDGEVVSYEGNLVGWMDDNGTHYFLFDAASGLIIIPQDIESTSNEIDPSNYTLIRDGELNAKLAIGYKPGSTVSMYYTGLISYNNDKVALFYDNGIYSDVTLANAFGEALAFADAGDSKTLVVSKNDSVIVALGSHAGKISSSTKGISPLDGHQGVYTMNDDKVVKIDGLDNAYWTDGETEKVGYYTLTSAVGAMPKVFDVFVREEYTEDDGTGSGSGWGDDDEDWYGEYSLRATVTNYKNVEYYVLTIGETAADSSFTKPMATLKYSSDGTEDPVSINTKVAYKLKKLNDTDTHMFRGWYASATEQTGDPLTEITIENETVIYAKWLEKLTLTIYYNIEENETPVELVYGKGDKAEIIVPTREDYSFMGWYTSADFTGAEWNPETALTGDVTIYAKWLAAYILTLDYNDGSDPKEVKFVEGQTVSLDKFTPEEIYVNGKLFIGWFTDAEFTTEAELTTLTDDVRIYAKWEDHDPYLVNSEKDGSIYGFTYDETNGWYASTNQGVNNGVARMALVAYVPGTTTLQYQLSTEKGWDKFSIYVNIRNDANTKVKEVSGGENMSPQESDWVDFTVDLEKGDILYLYYAKDNSGDGNGADTVWVRNIQFKAFDLTLEGDYTCDGADAIHLDGKMTITQGAKTGTYRAISEENKYEVYFVLGGKNTAHYIMELNKEAHTYTFTAVTATVTYHMNGHGEKETDNAFTDVEFTLPTERDFAVQGWKFLGWYTDAECTGSAVTKITPEADGTYEYYAKWVEAFTLTLVVGNGLDNEMISFEAADTINLANIKPSITNFNGLAFVGWYTDANCNDVAEFTAISEHTTVYAKWVVPHALYGIYKGFEFDSTALRNTAWTITIDAFGNVTGSATGIIEDYDPETGVFHIGDRYAYYDAVGKAIVTNYGASASSTGLVTDLYVMTSVEDNTVSATASYHGNNTEWFVVWDNNYSKLGKFEVNGNYKFFLVYQNKVYGNITVKNGTTVVTDLNSLRNKGTVVVIEDVNGSEILKFAYDGSTFVGNDGTGGDYSGALGAIKVDGYGNITIGEETVAYTIVDGNHHFVAGNAMRIIKLGDGTYTQVQDGYAGTYTLPDGTTTITLDGLGGAGDDATYVVAGTNVTIYVDGVGTGYGIDVSNKLFLGKSVFAGRKFTKASSDYIIFDDSSQIAGTMYCGAAVWYVTFTGVLNGNILTLTVTGVSGNVSDVNSTVIFTIEGSKMTLTSGSFKNCSVSAGYAYTCEGFSL